MNSQKERTIVITGGTGGIGLQSALGIARTGARILITGRNRERGEAAQRRIIAESGNDQVELFVGDLSSIKGIDALARAIAERATKIDVLVNNAGYLGNELKHSDDGFEMHFAVNVLAPWRLTWVLLPALKAADQSRVLNITGGGDPAAIDPNNLQAEKGFRGLMTYTHSKSVMESMSMILSQKLKPEGVSVNVLFPGRASTSMTQAMSPGSLPGVMKLTYPLMKFFFKEDGGKSAKKAARSTIWGATSSELDGLTGRYFNSESKELKLHPSAYDPDVQAQILAVIESVGQ